MSLFELTRVWEVWPQFTDSQVLRDLFRQAPTSSSGEKIGRVFAPDGYLFVATTVPGADNEECLYGFPTTVIGEKEGGPKCQLPLCQGGGHVVAVFLLEGEVCIVREWGQLEVLSVEDCGWRVGGSIQLRKGRVTSCVFHDISHSLVYCVAESEDDPIHRILACHCHLQMGSGEQKSGVFLGEAVQLLSACPAVKLWSWREGVAVLPHPAPPGLLLLWLPAQPSQLQPFILGSRPPNVLSPTSHYPTLCLQLAPFWSKASDEDKRSLVSVTAGNAIGQLLLLLSSGDVITIDTHGDKLRHRTVVKLRDFPNHYPQTESGTTTDLELFSLHMYCGIFCKGDLRLYEMFCGEMVWECGDHEGHHVSLLAPPFSRNCVGICGDSGVWVLRSHRLSEHTQLLSQALFPIATNADETTPGDYLEDGRTLAATLYSLWNLPLPATRSALESLLGIVQRDRDQQEVVEEDRELFLPHLSKELQSLLGKVSLQSPALLVALLAEHPLHRHIVTASVERYLQSVQDGNSTRHTEEITPFLMQYKTLSHEYESQIAKSMTEQLLPSPSALALSLLRRLEDCDASSRVGLRAQLLMLSCLYPSATLSGVKEFFAVPNFNSALEAIKGGQWCSHTDWRSVFGVEVANEIGKKTLDSTASNVPVFEFTCRLLYSEDPKELVPFVEFAQFARDCQAEGDSTFARRCRKTYFFQRAVQCLPIFVSKEATPTTREALLAHSNLLLHSELSGCEGSALGLLLKGELWEDAVVFLESQTALTSHIYCSLFQSLLAAMAQEDVLHSYIDRVWQLVPQKFSVFDLLGLLSRSNLHPPPPLVSGHSSLTVADIGSRLLQLLPTAEST